MAEITAVGLDEMLKDEARQRSDVATMDAIVRYRLSNGLYNRRATYEHHARVLRQAEASLTLAGERISEWRLAHP